MRGSNAPQYQANPKSGKDGGDRWGEILMRQAARIATNRTVAGVHFPVDSVAGAILGLTLADFITSLSAGTEWTSASFDGVNFNADDDFNWHALYCAKTDTQKEFAKNGKKTWTKTHCHDPVGSVDPALSWLWKKVQSEWDDFQVSDLSTGGV